MRLTYFLQTISSIFIVQFWIPSSKNILAEKFEFFENLSIRQEFGTMSLEKYKLSEAPQKNFFTVLFSHLLGVSSFSEVQRQFHEKRFQIFDSIAEFVPTIEKTY